MTVYSIPTLATALLSFGLGVFILSRNSKSKLNWTFASWCFLTCYWQSCWTVLLNLKDPQHAELLARLGYSGIIFIPIVFFHFVVEFIKGTQQRFLSYLFYSLGGLFLLSTWLTDFFVAGVYQYSWGYYPRGGALHLFYLAFLSCNINFRVATAMAVQESVHGPTDSIESNEICHGFHADLFRGGH